VKIFRALRSVSLAVVSLFVVMGASAASVSTVTITPSTVTGTVTANGRVTLTAPAGAGGEKIKFSSSNPGIASPSAKITIAQGQTSGVFQVMTTPVNNQRVVTITATAVTDASTASATLTVDPPVINGLGINPNDITGVWGQTQGVVGINAPAPSNGTKVTLTRSDTKVIIPNSVTVAAGQIYAYFNVGAKQVPSATVVTITGTTGTVSRSNTMTIEHCTQGPGTPPTGFNATDVIWIDDSLPAGMTLGGAHWNTTHHASGTQSLTMPSSNSVQQYQLTGATTPFPVYDNEVLFAYVLPSECGPTQEIMLGWHTTTGVWKKAYVGTPLIGGEATAVNAGPMPLAGSWVSIRASANALGLNGMTIDGFSVETSDGKIFTDHIGKTCAQPFATPPTLPAGDTYWIDDSEPSPPRGVQFDGTQHASGSLSLFESYFSQWADVPFPINTGEKLVAYALTDYCNPPHEMRITWQATTGETGGVYWGATQPADAGLFFAGPMPASGSWARLEVPASVLNLEGRQLATISLTPNDGAMWWDAIGKAGNGCALGTAPAPSFPPGDAVYLDDTPAGAPWGSDTDASTWVFDQHASGIQSFTIADAPTPGYHNLHVSGLPPVSVSNGDNLSAYVLLDPCNPPTEVAITWNGTHGAYWGTPHGWEAGYTFMGPIPGTPGTWQRLEAPAQDVNMGGQSLTAIQFNWQDGQAWWDHAATSYRVGCTLATVPPPSIPAGDSLILDDSPVGAPWGSDTDTNTWVFDQFASGIQSWTIYYPVAPAYHNLHVTGLPAMPISSGDNLIAYVLIEPCHPATELAITWNGSQGAYWGTPHGWESGYAFMGPIPATPGVWQRLEVPATTVNMQGQSLTAIQFNWQDGQAWWDHAGKNTP
jgi:hypothetical protein